MNTARPDGSATPFKTHQVLEHLRANIVGGRYAPGHRLPTFAEMEGEFAVGRAVIQHAVATLKRDGFVRSVNRQGLYVVSNPPHLHQYGLVFASAPGEPGWTRLTTALTNEAHRIERRDPNAYFRFHHGVDHPDTQMKVLRQLRDDIKSCRVAGLILTPKTFDLLKHPMLTDLHVPTAHLWSLDESATNVTRINVDAPGLMRRSLEHLKHAGRRRIAVLHMADTTWHMPHQQMFDEAGLELHEPWIQHVGRSHPHFAEGLVRLLMDYRFDVRPDGLIIADDNLVEPAARGLIAAGVKVGVDCDVVAHTNWPWPPPSILPTTRIGFDIRDMMRRAIEAIDLQARTQTPPPHQIVPALFEWEVEGLEDQATQ